MHTFLKDGLKDILLEQSSHTLSDMSLECVIAINGLFMGLSVCIQKANTLDTRGSLKPKLTARRRGGRGR